MGNDHSEVEESLVVRRSSVVARVVVGCCLLIGLVAGARWFAAREPADPDVTEEAADEPLVQETSVASSTTTPRSPQSAAAQEVEPAIASVEVAAGAVIDELALGAPEGTRVAYGTIDGGLRVVDLGDGSSIDMTTVFPLAMTANFLVGRGLNPSSSSFDDTTLVIIDLRTHAVATLATPTIVETIVPATEPDRVWLWFSDEDGRPAYQLVDLRDGGTMLETLDVPMWSWMIPAGAGNPPLLNVLTNGVYVIEGIEKRFLGTGTVHAASSGGAVWTTCDDSLVCATELVKADSSIPLGIDGGAVFEQAIARVSPDGRFVAVLEQESDGVVVVDSASGVSSHYEVGHVWTAEGLVFLDHRLLVWSESALKVIDAKTGEITHLEITPNFEYVVSSQ